MFVSFDMGSPETVCSKRKWSWQAIWTERVENSHQGSFSFFNITFQTKKEEKGYGVTGFCPQLTLQTKLNHRAGWRFHLQKAFQLWTPLLWRSLMCRKESHWRGRRAKVMWPRWTGTTPVQVWSLWSQTCITTKRTTYSDNAILKICFTKWSMFSRSLNVSYSLKNDCLYL